MKPSGARTVTVLIKRENLSTERHAEKEDDRKSLGRRRSNSSPRTEEQMHLPSQPQKELVLPTPRLLTCRRSNSVDSQMNTLDKRAESRED